MRRWRDLSLRAKTIIGVVVVALVGSGTVAVAGVTELRLMNALADRTYATHEMTRSIGQAAAGSAQIAQTITEVAGEAGQTAERAGAVQVAATDLDRLAEELDGSIAHFRCATV